jgi:hypothetical protein
MPDMAWKAFERRIAGVFGGKRRGADTRTEGRGKTDVVAPGWAIECKLLSRPGFADLLNAARQAEANADSPADIPVALVKRKGDPVKDTLVVIRLERFEEFFVNEVSHD